MRIPDPIANTTTEAYLAYKAGVLAEGDLKPKLYDPYIHLDAWLAYWAGLTNEYPLDKNGDPEMLTDEEAYIAYLSGVTNTYPEEFRDPADIRVAAYLRYLISARFGRPEYPVTNEELYLSMLKTKYIPSGDPSSDIVIDGTAKAPFVDVKMYGDTFQKSYTGKNLLQFIPRSGEGMTVTYDAKTGLAHVSGTNSSNDGKWSNICESVECSIPAGTYTLSVTEAQSNLDFHIRLRYADDSTGDFNIPDGSTSKTFEMPKDAKRVYIWYGGLTPTYSSVDFTVGIQLEAGSAATSFEPYVGGQPSPNPDYPQQVQTVTGEQTVEVIGKNLIDPDGLELGNIDASGNDSASQQVVRSGYIRVVAGSYTLKVNNSGNNINLWRYAIYDNSKTFISANVPQDKSATITIANNGYIRVSFYNVPWKDLTVQEIIGSQVQLELGSTASAYTPYSKQTLPIDLGSIELCKLGDSQDYIWEDDGEWKIHKAIATHLFDGSTNDGYNFNADQANTLAVNLNPDKIDQIAFKYTSTTVKSCMTASFRYVWDISDVEHIYVTGAQQVSEGYNGNIRLYILKSRLDGYSASLTNAEKAQLVADWLASNPMKVYYIPRGRASTDTVITNQNLIDQLNALKQGGAEEGTTYIKVDATDPNLPGLLYVEAPKYE